MKDVSFLIDVLPAYVFPNDERTIGEWVLAGFSLGGHATWLGLRHGAYTPPTLPPHTPSHSNYSIKKNRGSASAFRYAAARITSG